MLLFGIPVTRRTPVQTNWERERVDARAHVDRMCLSSASFCDMSATTPYEAIVDSADFQTSRETPNQRVSSRLETAWDRDPRTCEQKEHSQQQAKFLQRNTWKRDTWRRTEHSASSQEANDDWDVKSVQDKSNVIINTDQKGSCLSPKVSGRCKRQKFRDEVRPESRSTRARMV